MNFNITKYATKLLVRIPFLYRSLTNAVPVKKITYFPNPCWSGDGQKGDEIMENKFHWLGHLEENINSPWEAEDAPYSWIEHAHSFNWLYDTRLSTKSHSNARVQEWTQQWLDSFDNAQQPIWRSDIVARRLTNLLVHYDYYFTYAEKSLQVKLLSSITKHFKHLEMTEGKECDDPRRLTALRGLIIGAVSLDQDINIKRYILEICQTLEHNLASDGLNKDGHLPSQVNYLKDCILIRSTLHNAQMDVPTILDGVIDKMVPVLKFFMHPDGELAHMAGWSGSITSIEQIINRAGTKAKTPESLEKSGFYHINANKTSILFDAYDRKNNTTDNAGVLSFEMSHKKQRIFVNCGYPMASDNNLYDYARGTPAHSTFAIQGYNAISLGKKTRFSQTKSSQSEAEGWQMLQGQHNGYQDICNASIKRIITINQSGTEIRGHDRLEQISGVRIFENRFHLHPKIDVMPLPKKREAILRHGKIGWNFRISGGELFIEESFYMQEDGTMRQTQQIVIRTKSMAQNVSIKWLITTL